MNARLLIYEKQQLYYLKSFSEKLLSTLLIHAALNIREHTAILTDRIITNAKSVFGVWVDSGFVELVDVLECWIGLQEGLCFDAELYQNRSQSTLQSIGI